jgi:predicted transcriptional regulator
MDKLCFTPEELAKEAGISLSQLYKLWKLGKGPKYKSFGHKGSGEIRRIEHGHAVEWLRGEPVKQKASA